MNEDAKKINKMLYGSVPSYNDKSAGYGNVGMASTDTSFECLVSVLRLKTSCTKMLAQ